MPNKFTYLFYCRIELFELFIYTDSINGQPAKSPLHFMLHSLSLYYVPLGVALKMKAIKELLGISLLLGMACSSAGKRNHGRSLNDNGHKHRGGNEDKMGRREVCDPQVNTCLFSSVHSTHMCCMPTRVRHYANLWEYRNEKVKVSVIVVLMLMEDSRKYVVVVECYERYKVSIMGKAWRATLNGLESPGKCFQRK